MNSCGTFWCACDRWPGSPDNGLVIHTVLTTSQSASVTPLGSTRVVAWKVQSDSAASPGGLVQRYCPGTVGTQAAPVNVVGLSL